MKSGRTYHDDEMMARITERVARHDWAKEQADSIVESCAWLLDMPDAELWEFVPPPEQIRAINVCIAHDCPTCGDKITRAAGHYPWNISRERPFKLECPVCEQVFPSYDFEPWNLGGMDGEPESGPGYVDKGLGWRDADDRRYYFVPYYIFWQRWVRDVLGGMSLLGQAYLLTGDPAYAHKCAIMMCKLASEYERFDYEHQAYHEGISGVGGRISDYIWSTGNDSTIALAYDAIYPALDRDAELGSFLRAKGLGEACTLVEDRMLFLMVKDVMTGFVRGNMGAHQKTLAHLAIVLDNDDPNRGATTGEMREWIMYGPGKVEDLLWNGFWRDGLGGESSPSYSSGWCHAFYMLADLLPRLGVDIWDNPRLKRLADIGIELTIADKFYPSIGDCGSMLGSEIVAWTPELQGRAFRRYGDARFAKVLSRVQDVRKSIWEDFADAEQVKAAVAAEGPGLGLISRNLGGYGLAILERGEGPHRRAVRMYYGDASGGHGHYDRLSIEMFAFGRPMMPEDGYPTPFTRPDFHEWRRADTYKHYCVMIDELPQTNLHGGQLDTFAVAPELQLMDASAEIVYEDRASLYRRTSAMVDISAERSYLLDVFRVRGGSQHDWCLHGPAFTELSVTGADAGRLQTEGTLAGEDVPYGTWPEERGSPSSGYQGLWNVRRIKPTGDVCAVWRKEDEDLSLTMRMPAGSASEIITAHGEPELVPGSPDKVDYLLARNVASANQGEASAGLLSNYVATFEPHKGASDITGLTRLVSDDASPETIGLLVRRGNESDLIHSSLSADERVVWKGAAEQFVVCAEFALLTTDRQGVKRACVVDGSEAAYGGFSMDAEPCVVGEVVGVDLAQNTVTLGMQVARPEALANAVVTFGDELHKTSYTVASAEVHDRVTVLHLGDVLITVGMGVVVATDGAAGTVTADRDLMGRGRTDWGRHAGRWLFNEDRSVGFRIASIDGQDFVLEGTNGDLDSIFQDSDGDGRRVYWISDVGPGDSVRIPSTTWYSR